MQALASARHWFNHRLRRWLDIRHPARSAQELRQRNIFIVPTAQGMLFLFAAVLVFLVAVNYAVSLAFVVAFLMVGIFLVSILHTFANLHALRLHAAPADNVFAGEPLLFRVHLDTATQRSHHALAVSFADESSAAPLISVHGRTTVVLQLPPTVRGRFEAPRLRVESRYPLGLCRAWALPDLALSCLVYPTPQHCRIESAGAGEHHDTVSVGRPGSDDFSGLRAAQPGDSPARIAWKQYSHTGLLLYKHFTEMDGRSVILDWDAFSGMDVERRLSCLCFLALQAAQRGDRYGLRLPGVEISPGYGQSHRAQVLEALALWR